MFMCLALQWVVRTLYMSRFASTSFFHAIVFEGPFRAVYQTAA